MLQLTICQASPRRLASDHQHGQAGQAEQGAQAVGQGIDGFFL